MVTDKTAVPAFDDIKVHVKFKLSALCKLLPDVAIIADEVDAQLKQQMLRFMAV